MLLPNGFAEVYQLYILLLHINPPATVKWPLVIRLLGEGQVATRSMRGVMEVIS
jgi:hypothetical protein